MREKDKQMLTDHYLDFYRMAFALLHDDDDTQDAVQEALSVTFSRVWLSQPYYYCVRVLYNQCCNILRRRQRMQVNKHIVIQPEPLESDIVEYRLSQLQLFKDNLPPRMAEIIDLYYYQGLTYKQIADQKGVSESAIKKLYYKGIEILRNQFVESEKAKHHE